MGSITSNRIIWGGATLAALLVAIALAGCGGGSASGTTATSTTTGPKAPNGHGGKAQEVSTQSPPATRSADAELLDRVLARQEAAVDAYAKVIPTLAPRPARMAAYFRAQEQEHVDATVKALRGLGAPVEPEPAPVEPGELGDERERLEFLYALEGSTIDEELSAISKLEASWPRSLLASTVADQAQHRTLLRQALGAGPLASVPAPFDDGTTPPPQAPGPPG